MTEYRVYMATCHYMEAVSIIVNQNSDCLLAGDQSIHPTVVVVMINRELTRCKNQHPIKYIR